MTSFITHQLTSTAKAQPLLCPIMCRTELSQATQRGTSSAFVGCSSFFKAPSLVLFCLTQWSCCRVLPWSNFSTCLPAPAPLSKPPWTSACTASASQNGYLNKAHSFLPFSVTRDHWTFRLLDSTGFLFLLVFTSSTWSENAISTLSQWPPNWPTVSF